jgi:thymidylate kinase
METRISALTAATARILAGKPYDNGASRLDISALLAFWKENKFPMLSLDHTGCSLRELPEFKADWQRHKVVFDSLRAEYVALRDRWAQAGIACLMIKSSRTPPSFPYTSDNLDLLVRKSQEEAARAILREQGYVELKHIEEPRKFLFRKFRGGEGVSAIHIHTQVGWEVGFLDNETLWAAAEHPADDPADTVPSAADVVLITLAHGLYENKEYRLADILKIRSCCQSGKIDWQYLERNAGRRGWHDGLCFGLLVFSDIEKAVWNDSSVPAPVLDACRNSLERDPVLSRYYRKISGRLSITLPFRISFIISKYLFYKKVLADRRTSLLTKACDLIRTLFNGLKLKLHIHSQLPRLVTFSGPDGSGKTQHARTLLKSMNACALKTVYFWNRVESSTLVRRGNDLIKTLTGKKREAKGGDTVAPKRREWLENPLLRCLWAYAVAIDLSLDYLLHVRLPLALGKIVVCDRYVYDAAAEMESHLPPGDRFNRLAVRLMLALAPRPHIAYFLDIPNAVATQRKDEDTDADFLRRQREAYTRLTRRFNLCVKKTDGDFNLIADEIVGEVLNPYFDGFRTFINGLFLSNPSQLNPRHTGAK